MPLWGTDASTGAAGDANKPKYLNQKQKEETFADSRGWVHRNSKGFEEVLVAIGSLKTTIGAGNITSVSFDAPTQTTAAGTVTVYYDEQIEFNGGGRPKIVVTNSKGANLTSDNGAITADQNAIAFGYTVTQGAVASLDAGFTGTNSGYTNDVAVTGQGSSGSSFTASVTEDGGVLQTITITDGGTDFEIDEVITIVGATSSRNTARVTVASLTGGLSVAAQTFNPTGDIEDIGTATNADKIIPATISLGTATFTF